MNCMATLLRKRQYDVCEEYSTRILGLNIALFETWTQKKRKLGYHHITRYMFLIYIYTYTKWKAMISSTYFQYDGDDKHLTPDQFQALRGLWWSTGTFVQNEFTILFWWTWACDQNIQMYKVISSNIISSIAFIFPQTISNYKPFLPRIKINVRCKWEYIWPCQFLFGLSQSIAISLNIIKIF